VDEPLFLTYIGSVNGIATAVERNGDFIASTNRRSESILYIVCRSGYLDCVDLLLRKCGGNVNQIQVDGSTPLHAAAYYGHHPLITRLLACGAIPTVRNRYQSTAEDEAACEEIVVALQSFSKTLIATTLQQALQLDIANRSEKIDHGGVTVAYRVRRDFVHRKAVLNSFTRAWHGTKHTSMMSIFQLGLLPPGSVVGGKKVDIIDGHIRKGVTVAGIKNWSTAVFASPSLSYACHAAYADRVFKGNHRVLLHHGSCCGAFCIHHAQFYRDQVHPS